MIGKISFFKTLHYNFFSKKVIRKNKAFCVVMKNTNICIEKGSFLVLEKGRSIIGDSFSEKVNVLLTGKSKMVISSGTRILHGVDILISRGGTLLLGENVSVGVRSMIRCSKLISINENSLIAHEVLIRDTNAHFINGKCKLIPIEIGKHVWICNRASLLPGASIGDESVVGACSLVNKSIPSHCLCFGSPARVIKTDIIWSNK